MGQKLWRPLLRHGRAQAALAAAAAIAADLRGWPDDRIENGSLFNGHAGMAIFFAHLARSTLGQRQDRQRALHHLERAVQKLPSRPGDLSFATGFAGVAWAMAHCRKLTGAGEQSAVDECVESILAHAIGHEIWGGNAGLFEGLAGIGLPLLERMPRPAARIALERLALRLVGLAHESEQGSAWWTPGDFLGGGGAAIGEYNLGVAHGVPGAIGILATLLRVGVAPDSTAASLTSGVRWLLAHGPDFPYSVGPGITPRPARLAWCYGAPGIAAVLLSAALSLDDEALRARALEIARLGARRGAGASGVSDACLCHGAAGIAHIYNRMFQATGDEVLEEAAVRWFQCALALRRPGEGVGGFTGSGLTEDAEERAFACADLLNGSAGIGLALLAAATPSAPEWDRCLLIG